MNLLASPDIDACAAVDLGEAGPATPQKAAWTVLCVDDEPNIVSALRRVFRGTGYRVLTANSGAEALAVLEAESVELVISDMRMPVMDGAQLLSRVRERWPDATRVLLTGYADVASTVHAINHGEVYRYISKPWNDEELLRTAHQVFERHALQRETVRLQALTRQQNVELAELNNSLEQKVAARTLDLSLANEKVKRNYLTSIKVFSNLIELRGGVLAGHSRRVAELARKTAWAMGLDETDAQQVFVAGLLHDMGQICLPDSLLARSVARLGDADLAQYCKHPALGEQALMAMEDMQPVAALVRAHHERHDGQGFPDRLAGDAIPRAARILAVVDTYDDLQNGHLSAAVSPAEARMLIARGRGSAFHPEVVDVFLQVLMEATPGAERTIPTGSDELQPGMTLARELVSSEGVMLLAPDQVLTAELIRLIRLREKRDGVTWTLHIKPSRKA